MTNTITAMVNAKQNQWADEATNNARRAIANGLTATLVQYPTGLQMMRFATPYGKEFGMHFEVAPEVWATLQDGQMKEGMKIVSNDNPEWGTWGVLRQYAENIWEIRGEAGDRVLASDEFTRFWSEVK